MLGTRRFGNCVFFINKLKLKNLTVLCTVLFIFWYMCEVRDVSGIASFHQQIKIKKFDSIMHDFIHFLRYVWGTRRFGNRLFINKLQLKIRKYYARFCPFSKICVRYTTFRELRLFHQQIKIKKSDSLMHGFVHFLRYVWGTRRFGNCLYSSLQFLDFI